MKKLLLKLLDRIAEAFRMPTEEGRALHHQLANYDAQAKQMRAFSHKPLPIGDEDAMTLFWSPPIKVLGGYSCAVSDISRPRNEVVFYSVGQSPEQARFRAVQLVSALDGARRL